MKMSGIMWEKRDVFRVSYLDDVPVLNDRAHALLRLSLVLLLLHLRSVLKNK